MATGVWSKRIAEAHERNGTQPGAGLAAASVMLIAVAGLGFRLKLQLLRTFARDAMDAVLGGSWSSTTAHHRPRTNDGWRRAYQQQHQRTRTHHRRDGQRSDSRQSTTGRGGDASFLLDEDRQRLEVHRQCTRAELKAAYYRKAKLYHPDSSTSSCPTGSSNGQRTSGEEFNKLKVAYDALLACTPK